MTAEPPPTVDPDELLTVAEVLKLWPGRFTENELRKAIARGHISVVRKGKHKMLTRAFIREYLSRHVVAACQSNAERPSSLNSEISGSTGSVTSRRSTDTGLTEALEKSAADLLVRQILSTPNGSSQRSSSGRLPLIPRGRKAS